MEIIINKKGLILSREDGAKDRFSGGMVTFEGVGIELVYRDKSFYRSWMNLKNISVQKIYI